MTRTLSRYLKDFGAEQAAPAIAPAPVLKSMPFEDTMVFAGPEDVPLVDLDAERREAYAEGHEAATQALSESHQEELDALMVAHEAALEELKAKFEVEAVERISQNLQQMADAIGIAVSAEVSRALSPILTETLTAKAIDDLASLVTASVLDGAVGPIVVSGRQVMFDSLSAKVDPEGVLLTFVEAEDIDLCVTIGETVLVTRMSAWADSLRNVLS